MQFNLTPKETKDGVEYSININITHEELFNSMLKAKFLIPNGIDPNSMFADMLTIIAKIIFDCPAIRDANSGTWKLSKKVQDRFLEFCKQKQYVNGDN